MGEIAQQLARKLQQEEEEEEATVLVKLEELNMRTQTFDGPTQKLKNAPPIGHIQQEQGECNIPPEQAMVVSKSETLSSALAVPKETDAEKVPTESGKTKASHEVEFNPSSLQSRADAKHVIQPSEEHSSSSAKVSGGRVNSQLKSQHSRRLPRRMADKFHSSDNYIWAPVRPKNKAEVTDEASDKAETATGTGKSDDLVHNIDLKSKGPEGEKYDPKLVSKELAQHTSLDGTVGRADPLQNIKTCQPGDSATGSQNKVDKPRSSGPGSGRSSFAKKRRAKKLGVCHRCCLTTCNGEYGVCQGYVEGGCDSDTTISGIRSYVRCGLSNSEHTETQTEVETHDAEEGAVPLDVQTEA